MKAIPSTIHPIYLGGTWGRRYQRASVVLGPWSKEHIKPWGLVRVVRQEPLGSRFQRYQVTDDIANPQGDRLYFLLEVGLSRTTPVHPIGPGSTTSLRSFLLANSCRTLWIAECHPHYWEDEGTAYGQDLELVSASSDNMEHSFHPSIIPAVIGAIEDFANEGAGYAETT